MTEQNDLRIMDQTGNPAPLGLCGFGATTILLNLHNAGLFELDTTIIAMGIFYGGAAQVIAGIMEWKKNNTFGTIAFTSYGFFWMTLVAIWLIPALGPVKTPSASSMACYLGLWGLFTLFLFVGTLKMGKMLQVVFGSLVVLFALLALAKATGNHHLHTLAGYVGLLCGFSAFYTGLAQAINEVYKKQFLPLA